MAKFDLEAWLRATPRRHGSRPSLAAVRKEWTGSSKRKEPLATRRTARELERLFRKGVRLGRSKAVG